MGRSAKPRKAYKPIPKRGLLPITYGMDQKTKIELALASLMAISMFTQGHGSEDLAYTIINSILIGYELAIDEGEHQTMNRGQDAMKRVLTRGSYGKWGFSGDDLKDVTAAAMLSDQLQAIATRREMREALKAVLEKAHDYQEEYKYKER
jgi:hypothetical protein